MDVKDPKKLSGVALIRAFEDAVLCSTTEEHNALFAEILSRLGSKRREAYKAGWNEGLSLCLSRGEN